MMKGVIDQQNSCKTYWGVFDHASHAPQLRSATITCQLVEEGGSS